MTSWWVYLGVGLAAAAALCIGWLITAEWRAGRAWRASPEYARTRGLAEALMTPDAGPVTAEIPAVRAAPRDLDPWEQAAWQALLGPRRTTTTDPIECAEQWRQQHLGDDRG